MSLNLLPETTTAPSPAEEICRACGACCLGTARLWLSRKEFATLKAVGTTLVALSAPGRETLYEMNSPCGFLEIDSDGLYSCSIYGDKRRPRTCRLTQPEGDHCRDIQDEAASAFLAGEPDYPVIDLLSTLINNEKLELELA